MQKNGMFWGLALVVVGALLLVNSIFPSLFGRVGVWDLIWPLMLVLAGVWFLLGPTLFRGNFTSEPVAAALEGASEASVNLYHGAGRLELRSGAAQGSLLNGSCIGGVTLETRQEGSRKVVSLKSKIDTLWMGFPQVGNNHGYLWNLALAGGIPLRLKLETGASESILDLHDLLVTDLELSTGASSTEMTLPAQAGLTRVKVGAGAASVKIYLPEGVAGRIKVQSGLAGINIDPVRFPRSGGIYETPGYEGAANKADIFIETGVGSVDIK